MDVGSETRDACRIEETQRNPIIGLRVMLCLFTALGCILLLSGRKKNPFLWFSLPKIFPSFFMLLFAGNLLLFTSAAVIPIRFDCDHYVHLSVSFNIADSDEALDGTIELQFGLILYPDVTPSAISRQVRATGFAARSLDTFQLTFPHGVWVDTQLRYLHVSVAPDSAIGRLNFMIYPTSSTMGVFETEPQNPASRAFENQLFFSAISENTQSWEVNNMFVRLTSNGNESIDINSSSPSHICRIDWTQDDPVIPVEVMTDLLDRIASLGVTYRPGRFGQFLLDNMNRSNFENLPVIQFILQTNEGQNISLVILEPNDYVSQDLRRLKVRTFSLVSSECTLSPPLLKKLVVYFESSTNRIGFGEPLIEY